jgi:hypothetical protein
MSNRDPRFPRPLHGAEQVVSREWRDRRRYTVGDLIAYNVCHHDVRNTRTRTIRHEGAIAELWIDRWWGDPRERLYAEVISSDGAAERVHFWRDDVGTPMGVTGEVPDDAMF